MIKTSTNRPKNSYSTFTKYCYQKGTIPKDLQKAIPRSTRYTWAKQSISCIDDEPLAAFEQESFELAEIITAKQKTDTLCSTLEIVINLYKKIIEEAKNKNELLLNNKKNIIALINSGKDDIGLLKMCEYLSISTHQYHAWKSNVDCTTSLSKLCRKRFSSQLEKKEVELIKSFMEDKETALQSRTTVYYTMLRNSTASFSKTCFYKYCKLLGYGKRSVNDKCKKNKEGIKATKIAEILHTDITHIKTNNGKTSYLSLVEDNFSKYILLGRASQKPDATFLKENIETVINKYGLLYNPLQLIVDNGSENKGALDTYLTTEVKSVTKIIARKDEPFASNNNNMIEALHKKFKNEFLRDYTYETHDELVTALPNLIDKYNNQYHGSLFGYSPQEVWNGAIPHKESFREGFAAARIKRKEANRAFNCCKKVVF
jgi:putative transposase